MPAEAGGPRPIRVGRSCIRCEKFEHREAMIMGLTLRPVLAYWSTLGIDGISGERGLSPDRSDQVPDKGALRYVEVSYRPRPH